MDIAGSQPSGSLLAERGLALPAGQQHPQAGDAPFEFLELADVHPIPAYREFARER